MALADRFGWPGDRLLSQALRHSTIGAEVFDGRVRDGIGSGHLAKVTRPAKPIGCAWNAVKQAVGFWHDRFRGDKRLVCDR